MLQSFVKRRNLASLHRASFELLEVTLSHLCHNANVCCISLIAHSANTAQMYLVKISKGLIVLMWIKDHKGIGVKKKRDLFYMFFLTCSVNHALGCCRRSSKNVWCAASSGWSTGGGCTNRIDWQAARWRLFDWNHNTPVRKETQGHSWGRFFIKSSSLLSWEVSRTQRSICMCCQLLLCVSLILSVRINLSCLL